MRGRRWAIEDEKKLTELYPLLMQKELAEIFKISETAIGAKLKHLGIKLSKEIRQKRNSVNWDKAMDANRKKRDKEQEAKKNLFGCSIYMITHLADEKRKKQYESWRIKKPSLQEILTDICLCMDQELEMVNSESSKRKYTFCRQLFCFIVKKVYGDSKSHKQISNFLGYKEHTMSLYGCRKIRAGLDSGDPIFLDDWYLYINNSKIYKTKE